MPLSPCARSCALSPDGRLAVAGFDDGSLKVNCQCFPHEFYIFSCLIHKLIQNICPKCSLMVMYLSS